MTYTFYIFYFFSGNRDHCHQDSGNVFPICISDGFLYMCSEPFVMVLNVRTA